MHFVCFQALWITTYLDWNRHLKFFHWSEETLLFGNLQNVRKLYQHDWNCYYSTSIQKWWSFQHIHSIPLYQDEGLPKTKITNLWKISTRFVRIMKFSSENKEIYLLLAELSIVLYKTLHSIFLRVVDIFMYKFAKEKLRPNNIL